MDERLAAHLELAAQSDAEFIAHAFRTVLRREPDDEALERAVRRLGDGSLSRAALLAELFSSDEFVRLKPLDDGIAAAAQARAHGQPLRGLTAPTGDERAIEIPWVLSRIGGEARILDLGCAFAEPAYLAALVAAAPSELVGVDLAPAEVPGMHTLVADLRELPFEAGSFDLVLCISTIEHVGADNSVYGVGERGAGGLDRGLQELRRVVAENGRVLVTVPSGEREDHGWFVQLEPDEWRRRFAAAGFELAEEETYELGGAGWSSAPSFEPSGVRYGARGPGASAILCAELTPAPGAGFPPGDAEPAS